MIWSQITACTWWSAGGREAVVDTLAGDEVGMFASVIGTRWRTIFGEYPRGTGGSSSACNSKPGLLLPCKARDALAISFLRVQTYFCNLTTVCNRVVVFTVNSIKYCDFNNLKRLIKDTKSHWHEMEIILTLSKWFSQWRVCCDALVAGHFGECIFPLQITSLAVPYTHLRSLLCVALVEFSWTPSLLMSELAEVLLGQLGVSLAHWVDL